MNVATGIYPAFCICTILSVSYTHLDVYKRQDDMRQMVEEKLQKTLNERIGQSFEIVRSQLENVQTGLGEMKGLAQDVGCLLYTSRCV